MRRIAVDPAKVDEKRKIYLEDMTDYLPKYPIALTIWGSPSDTTAYLSPQAAAELISELSKMLAERQT